MLAHRLTIPPSEYREVEGYQIPDYKACFEHDPDVMLDVLRAVRCGLEELPDPLEGGAELYHEHENDSRSAANPELLKGWSGNENPQMVEDGDCTASCASATNLYLWPHQQNCHRNLPRD
jgi:hypothetical protein